MLLIDNPAGAGYSTVKRDVELINNDASFAKDSLKFMQKFYNDFSEYLKNELYIGGVSYGGLYAPLLAYHLHNHNQELKLSNKSTINLKGVIMANAVVDYRYDPGASSVEVSAAFNTYPTAGYELYKANKCFHPWRRLWEGPYTDKI